MIKRYQFDYPKILHEYAHLSKKTCFTLMGHKKQPFLFPHIKFYLNDIWQSSQSSGLALDPSDITDSSAAISMGAPSNAVTNTKITKL